MAIIRDRTAVILAYLRIIAGSALYAAGFQFFLYPVRVNRLGKIEVFKQTVQECPR